LAQLAHESGVFLAVDNSMLSPCFQQPLALGADFVIHSATKFLCGHSDVTAGAVVTNDSGLHELIAFQQNSEGAGLSPFESWLLLRGIKTLALRVERQNESARKVAQFLELHPAVAKVYYPGFKNHPGHEIHRSQSNGDGAVISFTTGDETLSERLVEGTRLFEIAVSFGSVGSVISLPCRMSHASIPQALKGRLAPPADLVRISVGIEDVDDLIDDLDQALAAAVGDPARRAQCYAPNKGEQSRRHILQGYDTGYIVTDPNCSSIVFAGGHAISHTSTSSGEKRLFNRLRSNQSLWSFPGPGQRRACCHNVTHAFSDVRVTLP